MFYFILSFPNPLEWLENSIEMLKVTQEELEKSDWVEVIKKNLTTLLDGGYEALESSIEICKIEDGPLAYLETLDLDKKNIEE